MKRTITLLIATALIFGMSQCKKNVETITPSDLGEAVHITVNVDDGGKHIVYPGTGAYVFEDGDKLYVGNNGKYRGTLTYNSGAFSGTINNPSTNDYLHFYFVGGLEPSATPSAGNTASFTVNIANQSSKLPVLSYAHSTQKYVNGTTTYGCTLLNKCGLVKFVPATATAETVKVGGMKTTATINFATGSEGITPTGATGNVTLYPESNSAKWAVLLPQTAVSTPPVTIAGYNSTIASVPAVTENYYNKDGVSIAMTKLTPPTGAAGGTANARQFSVSADKHVWFSQGNLQAVFSSANTSTCTWRFATNQYDVIGNAVANTKVDNNLVTQAGTVDLFGWVGASGSLAAYGINNSKTNSYYGNNANESLKADWGHNKISNGGNTADMWRTLTKDEWEYLFRTRKTENTINSTQNARYTQATINTNATSVNGVILFPDNYTAGTPTGVTWGSINSSSQWGTKCTTAGWNALQVAGCVFLPAAGYRYGTTVSSVDDYGRYWTRSNYSEEEAMQVGFTGGSCQGIPSNFWKYMGFTVRLVCNVEQ